MRPILAIRIQDQLDYGVAQSLGGQIVFSLMILRFGLDRLHKRFGMFRADSPGVMKAPEHVEPVLQVLIALTLDELIQRTVLIGVSFPLSQIVSELLGCTHAGQFTQMVFGRVELESIDTFPDFVHDLYMGAGDHASKNRVVEERVAGSSRTNQIQLAAMPTTDPAPTIQRGGHRRLTLGQRTRCLFTNGDEPARCGQRHVSRSHEFDGVISKLLPREAAAIGFGEGLEAGSSLGENDPFGGEQLARFVDSPHQRSHR